MSEKLNIHEGEGDEVDTKIRGAHVLASVNFEQKHNDIVQRSYERAMERGEDIEGERPAIRRNYSYISRLEKLVEKYGNRAEQLLCRASAAKLIVKQSDISEKFWERENNRSLERDDGELTNEQREEIGNNIREKQKRSVQKWSNYLGNEESPFPLWFKTYAFDGISKMGRYDGDSESFLKRRKGDISSYPNLNEAALSQVYQAIVSENGDDPDIAKLAREGNFNKLYSKFYTEQNLKLKEIELPENPDDLRGKWIEYGPDKINELFLASSCNGRWCIGQDYGTLEGYFDKGHYVGTGNNLDITENIASDINNKSKFILFHPISPDDSNALGVPVVSIRLNREGNVAEISGVLESDTGTQVLNDVLIPEVKQKVLSLPGGDKKEKAFLQREQLIEISKKIKQNEILSGDNLKFLWNDDYSSIGEYEYLGDSLELEEAKKKSLDLLVGGYFNELKLADILEEYGLGKSIDLIPKIMESEIDIKKFSERILRNGDEYKENWYRHHELSDYRVDSHFPILSSDKKLFAGALLENGLDIYDLYQSLHFYNEETFKQEECEETLLSLGIYPGSILKSLKQNEKRGVLPFEKYMEYAPFDINEAISCIDLTDEKRYKYHDEFLDETPGREIAESLVRQVDETAISQFADDFKKAESDEIRTEKISDKFYIFIKHLEREYEKYGYLEHIDDAVGVAPDYNCLGILLKIGAHPDMVIDRIEEIYHSNNDGKKQYLDYFLNFNTLMSSYKRLGQRPLMPDTIVDEFSPQFVMKHSDELMSPEFGASADAIVEKMDILDNAIDKCDDLLKAGASRKKIFEKFGDGLVELLDIIDGEDHEGEISAEVSLNSFNKKLASLGLDSKDKERMKNLLQRFIESIE